MGRAVLLIDIGAMADGCDTGVCGGAVPPLIGSVLTGTGMTLQQAAAALQRGERCRSPTSSAGSSRSTRRAQR
jgi:hypothetical protein